MSLLLNWEFPDSRIENRESEKECILREIKEELNLDIKVFQRLNPSMYDYPYISIELIPFVANQIGGNISLNEHVGVNSLQKMNYWI